MPGALLDLNTITRAENPKREGATLSTSTWRLVAHGGEAVLTATGFKLYVRRPSMITERRQLDIAARGGISFEERRAA